MTGVATGSPIGNGWSALVIHQDDDVAVALRDLAARENVDVRWRGTIMNVVALDAIPLGHKLALRAIAEGAAIRKYGEAIGIATQPIAAGQHVHVHNMASQRARRAS
jgi:altronate dehydratase